MEILRDNEAYIFCPYNRSHYIRKGRMDVHLTKCRKSYVGQVEFLTCDFNASHRIPRGEIQYHHEVCSDRKDVEIHVYSDEINNAYIKPTTFKTTTFVPEDKSWDEEDVPTYDPIAYCENNAVLRRLDTASAAVKRDFRIQERRRYEKVLQETVQPKVEEPRDDIELPPIPSSVGRQNVDHNNVMEQMATKAPPILKQRL